MSRYLTPSKVALLSLISIYTEGVVPNSSAIHVLSFVVSYLSPLGAGDAPSSSDSWPAQYSVSIEDLEKALKVHPSSIPGRSIWDLFLRKIWSIDSCDALELFFTEISTTLAKTREERIRERDAGLAPESGGMRLARCSPLGAFVRRAQLEFTRLQFHDSVKLWKGFVKYRLPTYRAWARRNPSDEQAPVDINLLELGLDTSSHLAQVAYGNIEGNEEDDCYVSTKEVERLLEFQIGELQSRCLPQLLCTLPTDNVGFGGRVPEELKAQLQRIIASGVALPDLIHYLR
jgi:anaphase-promoting complex subunit 5